MTLSPVSPDTTAGPAVLEARNVCKSFGSSRILRGVDFGIRKGEKVCIVGPSGSGKTTLLRCLNLLTEPTEGRLYFHGALLGEWPAGHHRPRPNLSRYRSRIGMVFQHFELFPHLTAMENITLGPRHVLRQSAPVTEKHARALLERIGLAAYANAYPRTLSGGQKQRVAIARALGMKPDLVLFDEPTSALDSEMVGEVLQLMTSLAQDGMTMVIVTHELGFARDVADRVMVMEHGQILEDGPTETLFEAPAHPRSREILRIGARQQ